jgi:hypothetical protein
MEFSIAVGSRDWDPIRGGWTSGALRLPGARVVAVYAAGRRASEDDYSHAGDLVRWVASPVPTDASITVCLEKPLETEDARLALEREKLRSERRFKAAAYVGTALAFLVGQVPALHLVRPASPKEQVVEAAYNQAAQALEMRLDVTRRKGGGAPLAADAHLAMYRRAVFQSMVPLNASVDVLKGALGVLAARRPEVGDYSEAVVRGFPELMRLRRNWLHDTAQPAFNNALQALSPTVQSAPRADVPLPPELDILASQRGQETVSDSVALADELQLLDKRLSDMAQARALDKH